MEAMVQHVAGDCAAVLGVRVVVRSYVVLQGGNLLESLAVGRP